MKAKVSVRIKPAILDPQGKAVLSSLKQLGFNEVSSVRIGKLIELEIEGNDTAHIQDRVEEMSRKLLTNPLVEEFEAEIEDA